MLDAGRVQEHDTPEKLLLNEGSAFSMMVQSTGSANAEYLRSMVLEGRENKSSREETKRLDINKRWIASSNWAAAARFALAFSLNSTQNDLQRSNIEDENNILKKTKDAVITLKGVLEGKQKSVIDEQLDQYQIPRDRWWSALYRIVEGLAVMGRLTDNRIQPLEYGFEDRTVDWDNVEM